MAQPPLVLGSSSPYRRALLERLGLVFTQASPEIDEARRPGEAPAALAQRLAEEKAAVITVRHPDAWVLASDQVAALGEEVLGKPGSIANAVRQLHRCAGREVRFHTAVCLARGAERRSWADTTRVRFRPLSSGEIERYVARDEPLDCAGAFRAEGLGSVLFEAIDTRDPSAIVGLPLIAVAGLLRDAGFILP